MIEHLFDYVLKEWNVRLELISFVQTDEDSLQKDFYAFIEMVLINGNPVCIELSGFHEHFTVISGLSPNYIDLFDSDRLKRISRRAVHVGSRKSLMRHNLHPKGVHAMRVELQHNPIHSIQS